MPAVMLWSYWTAILIKWHCKEQNFNSAETIALFMVDLPCKLNCMCRAHSKCIMLQEVAASSALPVLIPLLWDVPTTAQKSPWRGPGHPKGPAFSLLHTFIMTKTRRPGSCRLSTKSPIHAGGWAARGTQTLRSRANREHAGYLGFYKSFSYQSFWAPNAKSSSRGYHVDLWPGIYELVWIK